MDVKAILDATRLERIWQAPRARPDAAVGTSRSAMATPDVATPEPTAPEAAAQGTSTAPVRPAMDAITALGDLGAEIDRVFPAGSRAQQILAPMLDDLRARLMPSGATPAAQVDPAALAAIDALEDTLEALLHASGWPEPGPSPAAPGSTRGSGQAPARG